MSNNVSSSSRRYAEALLGLTQSAAQRNQIRKQLFDLRQMWEQSRELQTVFEDPRYTAEERQAVAKAWAAKAQVDPLLIRFCSVLAESERLEELPMVASAFSAQADASEGRVQAELITVEPVSSGYLEQVQRALEAVTGQQVSLTTRQDPDLIGGAVAKVGGRIFDGSVLSRLSVLEQALEAT